MDKGFSFKVNKLLSI